MSYTASLICEGSPRSEITRADPLGRQIWNETPACLFSACFFSPTCLF